MAASTKTRTSPILLQDQETETIEQRREKLIDELKREFATFGKYKVRQVETKNIMFIGRSRTGKSTIKSLLADPTEMSKKMTLKADKRNPEFSTFFIDDHQMVLNIIDTPGLFERGSDEIDIRGNDAIMNAIEACVNREITKLHVVCFCVAVSNGINQEDVESIHLFVSFLGHAISKNSCLIVTHSESQDEAERAQMTKDLQEDTHFKPILPFLEKGIFYTGSLKREDVEKGHRDAVIYQFKTINDYRNKLIDLFLKEQNPFLIDDLLISKIRQRQHQSHERIAALESELKLFRERRLFGTCAIL